ncbi:MAG: sigma-70 family RNA polymerase sigma factor [Nannocystaceae bacterium]|nr:sigma-70 family RNA polymerase sigma factor [Nannocystaceae bacterium]
MDSPLAGHGAGAAMQSATSFKNLYEEHYGFVWATVCRFGVTPMLAEDAVHDTFIVAYRRRAAFDGESPRSWLYSIGRRVASNYRRSLRRRESRHAVAADLVKPAADLESEVSAKVSLDRFVATLNSEDRELFVLSEIDGLTGPELAATLGRKLPTVYGRVRVLRKRFTHAVESRETTLQAAKRDRPRAKAGGWLLLQPALSISVAAGGSKFVAGALALSTAALVWIGVSASQRPAEGLVSQAQMAPVRTVSPPTAPIPDAPQPPPTAADPAGPEPAPALQRSPPQRKKSRVRSVPTAVADPKDAYDLAADTKLLQDANGALRADQPLRALELLAEHERRFPSPAQPDLRTAIWVGALCAQGRAADARRRADALRVARPNSPMLPRIDATCVAKKSDTGQP